ncbi:thiamine phosphate synthase [Emcibacter nanhaiensis]|uniref:Thiamine-phosphate synthase n=1 Tax=Emcibacter nanhaiensis TaxID=1505037 RepID=A0A501PQI6_9PROT|nr:thiamine phosphate synthase [Emcibacter nanhaiensis]TPD61951.1 thiamine phosphate synthase [Emcibacter nanhaiensis]
MADTRLYLISPPRIDTEAFAAQLTEALEGGDVASFQLRLKGIPDVDIERAARVLMPICHKYDVAFLINDNPKLVRRLKADGVHVGQGDTPYAAAREIVGPDAIVGVTCHNSRHLAMEAGEAGADYVAFGAFFPTNTKDVSHQADREILSWWTELFEVPCVAIGGITVENCRELIEAGADFIAVSGGVWNHPDGPREAVRQFNQIIQEV